MILMAVSMKTCFFFAVNQSLGTADSEGGWWCFLVAAAPGTTTLWRRKESSEKGNEWGRIVLVVEPCGRW